MEIILELVNLFWIILIIIFIHKKFNLIMGKLEDVDKELENIKAAAAEEKVQVSGKLTELDTTIQELKDQIANGGPTEQIDALILKAQGIVTDIKTIYEPPVVEGGEETT
jgi:hypothetical protein